MCGSNFQSYALEAKQSDEGGNEVKGKQKGYVTLLK